MSGRMKRLTLAVALAFLAGCGVFGGDDDTVNGPDFFRDTDIPLASTTRFAAADFDGFWHMRATFAYEGDEVLRGGVDFRAVGQRIAQVAIHGEKRGGRVGLEEVYDVEQTAPGRFTFGTLPYATEYWVLWVDADYRTAVIGTPSGSFGWILDRSRSGGEDRIKAAREILDWMGYDMARLVTIP